MTAHNNDKEEKDLLKENVRLQRELRDSQEITFRAIATIALFFPRRKLRISNLQRFDDSEIKDDAGNSYDSITGEYITA